VTVSLATHFREVMSESIVAVGDSPAAQDKEGKDVAELEAAAQEARKREAARQRKAESRSRQSSTTAAEQRQKPKRGTAGALTPECDETANITPNHSAAATNKPNPMSLH
jgi:hypothetical protein